MQKIIFLPFLFILTGGPLFSQSTYSIRGKVTGAANGLPIARCSVFINNSSRGTITNESGEFELHNIDAGNHQLIVSSVGYDTYVFAFAENQLPAYLQVKLTEKITQLSAVEIEPFIKDGWQQYGKMFLEGFIGTTANAYHCNLKNKEVIRFRYSAKKKLVTAVADEPLIIENNALGYTIQFQLEKFTIDQDSNVTYLGYTLFDAMTPQTPAIAAQWEAKRMNAYNGSMMHFMRSFYNNSLKRDGFGVFWMGNEPNREKARVKAILDLHQQKSDSSNIIAKDSMAYYAKVIKQPDSLKANYDIAAQNNVMISIKRNKTVRLFFLGELVIDYTGRRGKKKDRSSLILVTPKPVSIERNGSYYPALEFFLKGHFALWEKLCNTLPFDYNLSSVN